MRHTTTSRAAADTPQSSVAALSHLLLNLGLALLLSLSMLLRTTCMEICYFTSVRLANNARSQLIIAVFRSAIASHGSSASATADSSLHGVGVDGSNSGDSKRSGGSSGGGSGSGETGRLTNLLATDADSVGNASGLVWCFACWTFSLCTIPFVIYLMWTLLGNAAFVGCAAFLASNFAAGWLAVLQKPIVRRLQERRDARGALMSDVVRGIHMLKAYGCEDSWEAKLHSARAKELIHLRNLRYLDAAVSLACGLLSQAAPVAIFSWYVLVQRQSLDATTAFSALAWIFQMRWSIDALPAFFNAIASLLPMLRRLASHIKGGGAGGLDSAWGALEALSNGGGGGGGGGAEEVGAAPTRRWGLHRCWLVMAPSTAIRDPSRASVVIAGAAASTTPPIPTRETSAAATWARWRTIPRRHPPPLPPP